MAEIETKRHVAATTGQEQNLPEAIQRKEHIEVSRIPDFQRAVSNYAESTNWMSALGSKVAQSASTAIASKLGRELGENPQGELPPPITNFDKAMRDSYQAQAYNTLAIQAQKLITNSNLELAAQPRIDSAMIAKTQQSNMQGLQKIFSSAPDEARSKLDYQYASIMINQNEQLVTRMRKEQKDDRIDQLSRTTTMNNENAYALAYSGNDKAAQAVVNSTIKSAQSSAAIHDIEGSKVQVLEDTLRISQLSGKYDRLAEEARKNRKLPEFLKQLADTLPADIPIKYKDSVYKNILYKISTDQQLRSQSENLQSQLMHTRIAIEPGSITDSDWMAYESNVSPLTAARSKELLLRTLAKKNEQDQSSNLLSAHWGDAQLHANMTESIINKTFNDKVKYAMEQSQKVIIPLKAPTPLTLNDAQVMVAGGAGGPIPVFTKTLKNELSSSNPVQVESAMQKIHSLMENGNGQALKGLSDQDWSMFTAAEGLRDSPDPIKGSQDIHNRLYNEDPDIQKLNKQILSDKVTKSQKSIDNFALGIVDFNKDDFINPNIAQTYGLDIFRKFSNYFAISKDFNEATISTKRWADINYGFTFMNGDKTMTLHPMEKVVGIDTRDVVPFIQENIAEQLSQKLVRINEEFDKNKLNEKWEIIPVEIKHHVKQDEFRLKTEEVIQNEYLQGLKPDIQRPKPGTKILPTEEEINKAQYLHAPREYSAYKEATIEPSKSHGLIFKTFDPIKIKRTTRTANGTKTDVFNLVFIANQFGSYDVALSSPTTFGNLYREAPYLGIKTVIPDGPKIRARYNQILHE